MKIELNWTHIRFWIAIRWTNIVHYMLWDISFSIEYVNFNLIFYFIQYVSNWFSFYSHAFQKLLLLLLLNVVDNATTWCLRIVYMQYCNLYICMTFCTLSENQLHNWLQFAVSFLIIIIVMYGFLNGWMAWLFNDQWPDVTIDYFQTFYVCL